jgi:hypothetical protein
MKKYGAEFLGTSWLVLGGRPAARSAKIGTLREYVVAAVCVAACLRPWVAASQSISIEHDGVGCIQPAAFPRFFARFDPREQVGSARLYRSAGGPHWYFVPIKAEGLNFVGVLPKPEKSLTAIEYYISVVDRSLGESLSAEWKPKVVSGRAACQQGTTLAVILPQAGGVLARPGRGRLKAARSASPRPTRSFLLSCSPGGWWVRLTGTG